MTLMERYLPPEAVIGFLRGLKLGLLAFVVAFSGGFATASTDGAVTQIEWWALVITAAASAAIALGGRTAEGYGDARAVQATNQAAEAAAEMAVDAAEPAELTPAEAEIVRKLRAGEISYTP